MVLSSGWPDAALWFQLCGLGLFSFFKYIYLNLHFFALLRGVVVAVLGGGLSHGGPYPGAEPQETSSLFRA